MSQSAVNQRFTEITDALNQPAILKVRVHFPRTTEKVNVVDQK